MVTKKTLCKIDSLLANAYKEKLGELKESKIKMSLSINNYGKKYLLYSFDKIVKLRGHNKSVDLLPFFKANDGVKSMCDYFLFCCEKGVLFILLIELKQGKEQVSQQLAAGNSFASYIVATLNRIENTSIKPEIRKISIRDYHINRKRTSMKSVVYDKDFFCTFEGSTFQLQEFLK